MHLSINLHCVVLIWFFMNPCAYGVDMIKFASENGLKEGERQYGQLISWSKDPIYGCCWQKAIEQMQVDCVVITDVLQSRLAFQLVNCFLETSGLEPYQDCDDDVQGCIRRMKDRDFASYATFFAHTQNMCYFLKGQVWRQKTEGTIDRLVTASSHAGDMLERVTVFQERTSAMQERLLRFQKESQRNMKQVSNVLEASRTSAVDMFQQFLTMRSAIFDGLSYFYTVLYYTFSLCLGYLLTMTKRTERARFWLFLIFTAAIAAENHLAHTNTDLGNGNNREMQYSLVWLIRFVAIVLSAITLGVSAWLYIDWNQASYALLQANTMKLCSIEQCLQSFTPQSSPRVSGYTPELPNDRSFANSENGKTPVCKQQMESVNYKKMNRHLVSSKCYHPHEKSPPSKRYNLRDRSRLRSSSPSISTSILVIESSKDFADAVARSERETKQRSRKLRRMLIMEQKLSDTASSADES